MSAVPSNVTRDISTYALKVTGISKTFGGLQVIRDVSFYVNAGERFALIGPNGAGKSTIFNLISGAYSVDSGSVEVENVDLTQVPSRKRVHAGLARTFQNIRLMHHLTALENVLLGQHSRADSWRHMLTPLRLVRGHAWNVEARELLDAAGLSQYADSAVGSLPYGVQKRLEIVRALLSKPRVLLLDEPCAGLNSAERQAVLAFLTGPLTAGISMLVIEHDIAFIEDLCSHAVVLNFGEKIAEGSPSEVRRDQRVIEAYLGREDD